jgi:hypothetical protein
MTAANESRINSLEKFLETVPPGTTVSLAGDSLHLVFQCKSDEIDYYELRFPQLELYCHKCGGVRTFTSMSDLPVTIPAEGLKNVFAEYDCRNCYGDDKFYAINIFGHHGLFELTKFGEMPPFGPPLPNKLLALTGDDRELLLKGRRSENQGLGIAAFAYYRRVIEDRKDKLFDAVIKVAQKLSAAPELIEELKAAKGEKQFTTAVKAIKHGLPQVLLIDGHNPLLLLHDALSNGIHSMTDEECLELATSIRIVLSDLVERIELALSEQEELKAAVSKLVQLKQPAG